MRFFLFLRKVCITINICLRTAFAASRRFWNVVFPFSFVLSYFLISSLISSLTHWVFKIFLINLFILFYFLVGVGSLLLRAGFLLLQEVGATLCCGVCASHCSGFSCCRAWALGMQASVVVACGLSSCGSWALECRFSSCGAQALLLRGMWDLPRPGIRPVSPVLASGFLTTVSPGKS